MHEAGRTRPPMRRGTRFRYLSRTHDPGWRVRAGGRSARPGCRLRACVQACGRVGVCVGSPGKPETAQPSVRCETRRADDMRQPAGPATRRLAARTRQRPANTHAHYHHVHVHHGQCPSASGSRPTTTQQQQPHPHPHSHPRRQPQRSGRLQAAVGARRDQRSAVMSCPWAGLSDMSSFSDAVLAGGRGTGMEKRPAILCLPLYNQLSPVAPRPARPACPAQPSPACALARSRPLPPVSLSAAVAAAADRVCPLRLPLPLLLRLPTCPLACLA
jgi:hypothetical protein